MTQTAHRFREEMQIRSVLKDDSERVYLLNDIAKCIGYKAPHKFSGRCAYQKEKVEVHWKTGIKCGQSLMWAVNYDNYMRIAEAYEFPQEITDFISVIERGTKKAVKENNISVKPQKSRDVSTLIDNVVMALLELKKAIDT